MWNILAFFLGVLSVCLAPEIPPFNYFVPLCFILILWIVTPRIRWLFSFVLGSLWMCIAAQNVLEQRLEPSLISQTLTISGQVDSLPQVKNHGTRFIFVVEKAWHDSEFVKLPEKIRLTWYSKSANIKAGERWQLDVRVKPARGLANPGGFDYERWLFENKITTTGYVYNKGVQLKLADAPWHSVNALRQSLKETLQTQYSDKSMVPLVNALLIGDRSLLNESHWQVLTATGTNHLLAISGLHIGLVALSAFWLFNHLLKRTGHITLHVPAFKLAVIFSLIFAFLYAALAGFSIPTQRALVMISVAMLLPVFNRRVGAMRTLLIALLAVLLLDPLAALSISFWLSFFAVLIIVYSMQGRIGRKSIWWQWGRLQWVISLAIIPVLLFSFQSFSLVSPVANIIAVPWVSFLVVPLIFIAITFYWSEILFEMILSIVNYSLSALWWILEFLASLPFAQYHGQVSTISILLLGLTGVLLLLAPRGLPLRAPGLILLLPVFFLSRESLSQGEFRLNLLDVGQGLSAVIETKNHVLVYDTGAKFSESFNMGDAVVTPFLRSENKSGIDTLVVSHGDNDHIGGMNALQEQFHIDIILSGAMHKTPFAKARACHNDQKWSWDGVVFEVIYPLPNSNIEGNDASCVLKISNASHSLLLTGDIEQTAEAELIKAATTPIDVDVMVAPHHGSNTSSTEKFVQATSPEWILYPAGYRNRYGFPKQEVTARYQQVGSRSLISGESGAIQMHFKNGRGKSVKTHRNSNRRFWHSPVF